MALSSDYWKWYGNFQENSDDLEGNQKFLFQNAKSLSLDKAKTLLSVGAGTGLLDGYLVSKCMPEINHYIGVDSHKPSCDKLHETMRKFTNMKASIVNKSYLEWEGPDSAVDVILASHILYPCFAPDQMAAIKHLYGWLKPGGSLIIVLRSDTSEYTKIAEEVLQNRKLLIENLKELLKKEGFTFSECGKSYTKLYTDCNNEEIVKLNFKYLLPDFTFTDARVTDLVKTLMGRYKGSRCETIMTIGYLKVDKPEI